jgi:hypothetical protein
MAYSVTVPAGVIRPILSPWLNQIAPSGPLVIPNGPALAGGS